MTDGQNVPHCHTQKLWGFRGRSCLCVYWSEVLSVLHIFIMINSQSYLEKVREAVSSEQCEHAEGAEQAVEDR